MRKPEVTTAVSRWWQRLPTWAKWLARLIALGVAVILPAHPIARVMGPPPSPCRR